MMHVIKMIRTKEKEPCCSTTVGRQDSGGQTLGRRQIVWGRSGRGTCNSTFQSTARVIDIPFHSSSDASCIMHHTSKSENYHDHPWRSDYRLPPTKEGGVPASHWHPIGTHIVQRSATNRIDSDYSDQIKSTRSPAPPTTDQ